MKEKSNLFGLNLKDAVKGLIVAIITAVLAYVYGALQTGSLTELDVTQILTIALTSAVGYILKNWLTDSDDKVAGKI